VVTNLSEVIAEAGGSEEFREILWVLVQEREDDGFSVKCERKKSTFKQTRRNK
jgi:hypothetical protein